MKKPAAVFTIVKDEDYFLPIWLKYYSQYFSQEDIYVLDHNTSGDSTKNLTCNVQVVNNIEVFNHQWLLDTVKNFQNDLLQRYEVVVFVEVDEILYSTLKPFNEVVNEFRTSGLSFGTCIGYEIMQNLQEEQPMSPSDSIALNRRFWARMEQYDKTLISKIPLNWCIGFHMVHGLEKHFLPELYMAHLHYVDAEQSYVRYQVRLKNSKVSTWADFWKSMEDKDAFYKRFANPEHKKHDLEKIPEIHTKVLTAYGL